MMTFAFLLFHTALSLKDVTLWILKGKPLLTVVWEGYERGILHMRKTEFLIVTGHAIWMWRFSDFSLSSCLSFVFVLFLFLYFLFFFGGEDSFF